ncbi:MAG: SCO family protein [Alicyclobacillus sp.]|nr:SCO family protein [Alicyclobacillus sp.]
MSILLGMFKRARPLHVAFYTMIVLLAIGIVGCITYIVRAGGNSLPVSGQAPNFSAKDITGKTISTQILHGKLVLITWYYTHCVDECPLTMYRFEQVQNQLEKQGIFGKKVVLVAITLDPARDTVPVIRQYAAHFHANLNGWYFLRTSPAETINLLNKWGIKVKPNTDKEFIEHTSKTELIDQNGNIRATYNTANLDVNTVLSDIHSLVARMNWL